MVQYPYPNNGEHGRKNPFNLRVPKSDAMDVDDPADFLNGPDADDFGSDYESAADDIAVAPPSTSQLGGSRPSLSYSAAQADAREDMELALALSASMHSPALASQPDRQRPPLAYSTAQASAREDMELALALSASMHSSALATGRTTTSNVNGWAAETPSRGLPTASGKAIQREPRWPSARRHVSSVDVDDPEDFLNGPDADDFGSDYESAADDIAVPPPSTSQLGRSRRPLSYSTAQGDAREDMELALALRASMHSPALATGRATTPYTNAWAIQISSRGLPTAKTVQRELRWSSARRNVSSADIDDTENFLNGPDADDFGSDYETAADDIAVPPPSTSQLDPLRRPLSYSTAQADAREDMELALALSASIHSPALASQPDRPRPPLAYSTAQASAREELQLALALSASMHSPALALGRTTTPNVNAWATQLSSGGLQTASGKTVQREPRWPPARRNVSSTDVDDTEDFLNGPDADDFGSDYETAADDVAVVPSSTRQPDQSRPPPYSIAQADAREDMQLALALSASMDSPALATGRATTSNVNTWATQTSSSGLSTSSEKAVQRKLRWTSPRTNVPGTLFAYERKPPQYSSIASAGGTKSSANNRKPLCVVCQMKPALNDGFRSFPTCSNSCARILEEAQQAAPKTKLQNTDRRQAIPTILFCVVCVTMPCRDGQFVTCGLTCAEKLATSGPHDKSQCDYCHRRPKVAGKNQCGTTCTEKAKLACLLCKVRPKLDQYHLCGRSCKQIATKSTPLILEAPEGHITYDQVKKDFQLAWKTPRTTTPTIKKVYKIMENKSLLQSYDVYKKAHGNEEVYRYHGTSKRCTLGTAGNTTLCNISGCALCSILRTSFKVSVANPSAAFGAGVYSSSASNKAYSYTDGGAGAMLLTKVVMGRIYHVNDFAQVSSCPSGYDSVVFDRHKGSLNETVVYTDDAIRPVFLIIF